MGQAQLSWNWSMVKLYSIFVGSLYFLQTCLLALLTYLFPFLLASFLNCLLACLFAYPLVYLFICAGEMGIKTKLSPSWVKLSGPAWAELGKNIILDISNT